MRRKRVRDPSELHSVRPGRLHAAPEGRPGCGRGGRSRPASCSGLPRLYGRLFCYNRAMQPPMRIEARDVTAGYGAQPVLQGLSLHLRAGEFLGLIGPNGAGKSTLLRVLSRTLSPERGSVSLDGEPADRLKAREIARRLAFVPQAEPSLFEFTVRDVVLMGRHPYVQGLGSETQEDFAMAVRAMAATDILQLADRPVTALSGGEHRRVLVARALAQNAPILLLDEPTAHRSEEHTSELQ